MTDRDLENCYREYLEEDIICCLTERRKISFEEAMALYYNSHLAERIFYGIDGIQYLDCSNLADIVEQEQKEVQTHV